jgi:hypothetical protein
MKTWMVLLSLSLAIGTRVNAAKDLACPEGIGASAGDPPQLSVSLSGQDVLVCGHLDTENKAPDGKLRMSEFEVVWMAPKVQKSLLQASAVQDYYVWDDPAQGLVLEEQFLIDGELHAITSNTVSCKPASECSLSKPTCALKLPKNPYPSIVKEIRTRMKSKKPDSTPWEPLLQKALTQALSGDQLAQILFQNQVLKRKLTGTANSADSELFEKAKSLISKAQSVGCLK